MSISRLVLIAATATGLSLQFGCSSNRLREGIWELRLRGQRVQNHREFPFDTREVRLAIEWRDSGDSEVVELTPVEGGLDPMYADVKTDNNNEPILTIDQKDEEWHWRMFGRIRDSETVTGEAFVASNRQVEDIIFEGRWDLQWLRDG